MSESPRCANSDSILIRGARQNNLRGFDLTLPTGKLIAVCGPSGSGKSSLAFDTLYAEGQRRYVETFSPYTRQFFDRMDKPAVDEIQGIPPAIAIEQVNAVKSTRSTVGSMTDLNDYLKLLLPRVVDSHCPGCHRIIRPASPASITQTLLADLAQAHLLITFPLATPDPDRLPDFLSFLQQQGYQRFWANGLVHRTDEPCPALPPLIHVIQDRLQPAHCPTARLSEALETALRFGKGQLVVIDGATLHPFSTGWHCPHCQLDLPEPQSGRFSFNHPLGACKTCRGFGRTITLDPARAIPDPSLSLENGAIKPFQTESGQDCQRDLLRAAKKRGLSTRTPFQDLPHADQQWVLLGDDPARSGEALWQDGLWYGVNGYFAWLESKSYKMHVRVQLSRYRSYTLCPDCLGGRFAPESLVFRWNEKTLPELMRWPVQDLHAFVQSERSRRPADLSTDLLLAEVESRLRYLLEVGLGYLTLDRPTRSLSGGETARVNLTTCLGTSLVGTLFVLDEPSIGLHPRDTQRLVRVLQQLRDAGNTLLVVEHEESILRAADHLVEIGPGRGSDGGNLVYNGPLPPVLSGQQRTLTGDFLTGQRSIPSPERRRTPSNWIRVEGASENNLQSIDVNFPLGVLCGVSGVSGSGKSTLVHHVLYRHLAKLQGLELEEPPGHALRVTAPDSLGPVKLVDQSPLSRTPRSSPALFLGVFDGIRKLFADLPESKSKGLTAGTFSFNTGDGRCERCSGSGFEKVEMQFLSDLFLRCPECEGRRYQPFVRNIRLNGHSIDEVLDLTIQEGAQFLEALGEHDLAKPLRLLEELGLSYLRLGQPLNGLSGGESQRLKLAESLLQQSHPNTLFILDEPTTGLHFEDIQLLLGTLERLVALGHSVLLIEHNLDVLRATDWIIDLGPEAGAHGGTLVAAGTPEQIAAHPLSLTGKHLALNFKAKATPTARVAEPLAPHAFPNPTTQNNPQAISVSGARHHNLKNLSVQIPRESMVVITGLSGSGKSSLAFDVLFAEGQRRFLDSMSPYARQFATQLERPEVDRVWGLPPTVAIEQRLTRGGGKSTVATVTEVYHFLRLLFSKVGQQHCPDCALPVRSQSLSEAVTQSESLARSSALRVLAPLIKARKGYHTDVAQWARRNGFETLLVDGKWVRSDAFPKLERFVEHTLEVLVGEIPEGGSAKGVLETGLKIGNGTAVLMDKRGKRHVLSTHRSCPGCSRSFEELDPRLFSFNSPHGWCEQCHGFGEIWKPTLNPKLEGALEIELDMERQHEALEASEAVPCPGCSGARLNRVARSVLVQNTPLDSVVQQSASAALTWMEQLHFEGRELEVARDILPEIQQRLKFLSKVGLDYLGLNRSAKTLSGGESQRIRLAAQLGSNLRGVLYVLDEPTIGLHPRDNEALLETLAALKQRGNSLVIVEHDEETLHRADHILDLGPGAGRHGGTLVAQGSLEDLQKHPESATGQCLRNPLSHPTRGARRPLDSVPAWIELKGACANNLQNLDVNIPVARLTVLTGISGSGKSSLMRGALTPAVQHALAQNKNTSAKSAPSRRKTRGPYRSIRGTAALETILEVDQSPIGKTSRSTPATYLGLFDSIRSLFASTPMARMRGYTASRFSFNTEGGRCESCLGQGTQRIEMNFLPAAHIRCPDCEGKRYNPATLEVLFQGRSIAEVLAMPMEEAAQFFAAQPSLVRTLNLLCDTGLGYLTLGQPSQTLSGGEAQRIKLVSELARGVGRAEHQRIRRSKPGRSILYCLEEPTIGLHQADVRQLIAVLHRLVDEGHTVVVIEHHTSLIAEADYLLEIGPEAGAHGGQLIASGSPEALCEIPHSRIAPYLQPLLLSKPPQPLPLPPVPSPRQPKTRSTPKTPRP
jgi:excinuclease ABC subunit A